MLLIIYSDEVEFRWTGNKLFLPGDANKPVGEVYDTYLTGDMAHFYSASGTATKTTKKAAGSQPQFSMAVELYIDKPKVSTLMISGALIFHNFLSHIVYASTTHYSAGKHCFQKAEHYNYRSR